MYVLDTHDTANFSRDMAVQLARFTIPNALHGVHDTFHHRATPSLHKLVKTSPALERLVNSKAGGSYLCPSCPLGKQTRAPFPSKPTPAEREDRDKSSKAGVSPPRTPGELRW